jgi:hypothetical protein
MASIRSKYLKTPRDKALEESMKLFIGASLGVNGRQPEGGAFAVVGESGTGKTSALKRFFNAPLYKEREEFCPFVAIKAPSPCTLKQLGREILLKLGYPVDGNMLEHITWERLRKQMKLRKVRFLWIDELHHVVRGSDAQKLRETLKNVMQQDENPVSLIVSAVPEILPFLDGNNMVDGEYQFFRRKHLFYFPTLSFPEDIATLRFVVRESIVNHAEMQMRDELAEDQFYNRLCHAAAGRFGMVIVLTRNAIERALIEDHDDRTVGYRHFAHAYRMLTGCPPAKNVFEAADWEAIDPRAVAVETQDNPFDDVPVQRERGRRKGGRS